MAKPKVIVQIYPMLPAEDRADRVRKRPLGRNRDLYQQVLHETFDIVRELDQMLSGASAQSSTICILRATRSGPIRAC